VVYSNHYLTAKKHTVVNIVDNVVELAVDFDGDEHPQYFMKTDIDGLWQECRKSAFNEVFQTGEYRTTIFKTTFYSKEDWDKLKEVENYSDHLDTVRYHLNELKELINSKNK